MGDTRFGLELGTEARSIMELDADDIIRIVKVIEDYHDALAKARTFVIEFGAEQLESIVLGLKSEEKTDEDVEREMWCANELVKRVYAESEAARSGFVPSYEIVGICDALTLYVRAHAFSFPKGSIPPLKLYLFQSSAYCVGFGVGMSEEEAADKVKGAILRNIAQNA